MSRSTFEDLLGRDGVLVYKTRGVSMEPMLRQDRDLDRENRGVTFVFLKH